MNTNITDVCYSINRRIKQMNYQEEKEVRELLELNCIDGKLILDLITPSDIANILEVNDNCIFDIIEDLK
jgi:hypothetical protein